MRLEEMKKRKQELGYSVEGLARVSGIPKGTLQKIFSGQTKSPRRKTMERLAAVLKEQEPVGYRTVDHVAESAEIYGTSARKQKNHLEDGQRQGNYTIEAYFALPEDRRCELIDGVLYDMAFPTRAHQIVANYLFRRLADCIDAQDCSCYAYSAPLDVQLDRDNRTMVQPDVMVCCDPSLHVGQRVFGAPEFLAEVVSPSTRSRDLFLKASKYRAAGVKEYWILDPVKEQVLVYLFYKEDSVALYSFEDQIPVSISEGRCEICFASIRPRLERLAAQETEESCEGRP